MIDPWPSLEARSPARLLAAIGCLDWRPEIDGDGEQPIFVLGNGWRTGSTLVQRTFVTDPRLLLWGEPLGRMGLISRVTDGLLCASPGDWPFDWHWYKPEAGVDLTTEWIANLFPPGDRLRASLRAWLASWLAAPATGAGFARWGIKEVRLDAADAIVLSQLFPRARFVIVVRDPVDAYRSCKDWGAMWYRWPDVPIQTATDFARHWNRLALSWLDLPPGFPSVTVRYEDLLMDPAILDDVAAGLDLQTSASKAFSVRVRSKLPTAPEPVELDEADTRAVLEQAREGMRAHGYSP